MSDDMTPAQEAAALWGSASNVGWSDEDRLAMALQALEFFGNEYDRLTAVVVAQSAQMDQFMARIQHALKELEGDDE